MMILKEMIGSSNLSRNRYHLVIIRTCWRLAPNDTQNETKCMGAHLVTGLSQQMLVVNISYNIKLTGF